MTELPELEFLVEEPSMEQTLRILLPTIVPNVRFEIRDFRGKDRLLKELPARLRGYASWIESTSTRIVVVVDRDDDDCLELEKRLDQLAINANLRTPPFGDGSVRLLNRIAVEELEAWFFGDVSALRAVYPRVPSSLAGQAKYRDPDAIAGGTWQALERLLKAHGYHIAGLKKLAAASAIARHMDVESNRSRSFQVFRDGLRRLVSEEADGQAHRS